MCHTPMDGVVNTARTVLVVLLILLAGCSGSPGDGGAPSTGITTQPPTTATSSPTATASTSSPTPTATPTATASPTAPTTTSDRRTEWTVTVVRVIDGDTLEVKFPDGHTEDVRLLGVDTPEVHVENDPAEFEGIPDTEAGQDWLRDWGHKASEFARTQVGGEEVTIRTDPEADRRGSYGRLLVYVDHDGETFNEALIEQGYARMYDSQFSKREQYASAEQTAQSNDVGLWNFDQSTTTTTDGGSDGGLAVAEVHADAAGNDHENLNDEYVVFENTGSDSLDISGWTVRDEADHTYHVPSGVTLAPGERVTLYTGSGSDGETELYWSADSAIWNNGGDTVIVTDENGERVVTKEY